jgi:hypothetical protein
MVCGLQGAFYRVIHNAPSPLPAALDYRRDCTLSDWSDEQTDDPLYADDRNFYKVEAWSLDGMRIDALLYAGNSLDKAREIFVTTVKHRPRIRLTIRQRTRVLQQWPPQ